MTDIKHCIRCDDKILIEVGNLSRGYISLTFNQEAGALPICRDCFEEVKERDMW